MTQPQTGLIRWWGLGAFVVLVVAIGLFWLLVVDDMVKAKIEEEGTAAIGAKVELGAVDLTLVPTGLTLTHLQVTNPDKPMTNMVEIRRLTTDLDGLQLLRRKVIIHEMQVEGVQFGTARTTSGAIDDRAHRPDVSESKEDSRFTLPPFEVPNVKQILEQEDLETLKLIRAIQTDIQREKEFWKKRLRELPGKEKFAKYKKRIESLKNSTKGGVGGMLGGVDDLKTIKEDIEHDLAELKSTQKEFDEKVALLNQRIAQVQTAPQRDVKRLKEKYSLSPQGLANLGQTLLGKQIGAKLKEAVGYYEMLGPYLEGMGAGGDGDVERPKFVRGQGQDIHFVEHEPLPELLIRNAAVSLLLDIGQLDGTIQNITTDQAALGIPLTYAFSGQQLQDLQGVTIEGTLDHRTPGQPKDTLSVKANGYGLQPVALSTQPDWPVTLDSGLADVTMNAELGGQDILASGNTELSSLVVSAGKPDDANPLTKALSRAVSEISSLSVQADITGTLQDYEVQIQSELDRLLKNAAGKMVKNLSARFGKELQSAISAKVAGPLKSVTGSLGRLDSIGGELTNRLAKENNLLKGLLQQSLPKKGLPKGLTDKLPGGFKLPF